MTPDHATYSPLQLDALRELANVGAGNATISLERLIGKPIGLDLPQVELLALDEAIERAGPPEAERYGIVVPAHGDFEALVLLLIDPRGAAVLYGAFGLARDSDESYSMLAELGNILASAYLGSLGRFSGMDLAPSPPQLVVDMLAAILATVLLGDGVDSDRVLFCDSQLSVEGERCNVEMLLIPEAGAVGTLIEHLGV
ncbi:MAG TPA: chemotaxis protein CheC [Baekduia sp.]|nr:chemotaxis protein CheC [Baekduia sp.]